MRYELIPERSRVRIEGSSSVHPIHAEAAGLTGWIDVEITDGAASPAVTGAVEIEVERLRSGNRLVDRETRRRIDARHHPLIAGTISSVEGVDGPRVSVHGVITFRGVSREVDGDLELTLSDEGLLIEGTQTFDVRRWGLEPPRVLALAVHPEIEVHISVEAEPT